MYNTAVRVRIRLTKNDLLTGEAEILAETEALYDSGRLLYAEGNGYRHRIFFADKNILIERNGPDMQSRIELYQDRKGTALVRSQYGDMELETELSVYVQREGFRSAEYRIFSGSDTVAHQRMTWERIR